MTTPTNLRYSKTHEWVKIEGTNATVGITQHAQEALGDITFVDFPKAGTNVKKEGSAGVIESVKAASDIYSPLAGKVAEINEALETAPESINSDPYGAGWIFKLSDINAADAAGLMDAAAYDAFVASGK